MSDQELLEKLATAPWERPNSEVVIEAEPADFLEGRRAQLGDIAMALEFGDPMLPVKPLAVVAEFVAAPVAIDDASIDEALDSFEMTIHTRKVRIGTNGAWTTEDRS